MKNNYPRTITLSRESERTMESNAEIEFLVVSTEYDNDELFLKKEQNLVCIE